RTAAAGDYRYQLSFPKSAHAIFGSRQCFDEAVGRDAGRPSASLSPLWHHQSLGSIFTWAEAHGTRACLARMHADGGVLPSPLVFSERPWLHGSALLRNAGDLAVA